MGTRNLTIVKNDNKTKVAQYGQWDGYPTGQGQTIADFIKENLLTDEGLKAFKGKINKLKKFDFKDKQFIADKKRIYGDEYGSEFVSASKNDELMKLYPELNRDFGAGILELISDGTITRVDLAEDFKDDDLFCEYYYTIDLDKKTVSVNNGKKYTFKEWVRKGLMQKLEDAEE